MRIDYQSKVDAEHERRITWGAIVVLAIALAGVIALWVLTFKFGVPL